MKFSWRGKHSKPRYSRKFRKWMKRIEPAFVEMDRQMSQWRAGNIACRVTYPDYSHFAVPISEEELNRRYELARQQVRSLPTEDLQRWYEAISVSGGDDDIPSPAEIGRTRLSFHGPPDTGIAFGQVIVGGSRVSNDDLYSSIINEEDWRGMEFGNPTARAITEEDLRAAWESIERREYSPNANLPADIGRRGTGLFEAAVSMEQAALERQQRRMLGHSPLDAIRNEPTITDARSAGHGMTLDELLGEIDEELSE